jgi:hypothetical protein
MVVLLHQMEVLLNRMQDEDEKPKTEIQQQLEIHL